MPSLSEAYDRREWEGRDPRRVTLGGALFVLGVLGIVAAILVVATPLSGVLGAETDTAAKRLAGVLSGLGIPAMLLGVVVLLPSSRRERVGAVVGATLTVAGVGLFWHAYPVRWTGTANSLAFETAMVYFLGGSVALWFVFSAVANFKVRNNPQGMVRMEVTRHGETKTLRVSRDEFRRYKQTLRGDGGETDDLIREIESKYEE